MLAHEVHPEPGAACATVFVFVFKIMKMLVNIFFPYEYKRQLSASVPMGSHKAALGARLQGEELDIQV